MAFRRSGVFVPMTLAAAAWALATLSACGPSNNAASSVLKKPELPTDTQAKCKVAKSQSEPLIVEWPETQRAKLESLRKRGLLAVHYEGCELSMLSQCRVKGTYGYSGITRKQSKVTIKDADELYASMPAFAVKLEGKLKTAGQLNVQMTLVGRYEAQGGPATTADLEGDCEGATHVVAALAVGAFTFFAGSDAEVGGGGSFMGAGAGGKSTANRELLQRDGDEASCAQSTASDKLPPEGCGAALQLEVIPIAAAKPSAAAAAAVAPVPAPYVSGASTAGAATANLLKRKDCKGPTLQWDGEKCVPKPRSEPPPLEECATGEHREGTRCVRDRAVNKTCEDGEYFDSGRCVKRELHCAADQHQEGSRCVRNPEPPTQSDPVRSVFGLGAIGGFGAGAVLGVMALAKVSKTEDTYCNKTTKVCSQAGIDERDAGITLGWISTVGFGVGALSSLGWLLWPSISGSSKTNVAFTPLPGGGTITAGGKF
ncbi:MAG: hypothetical protein U0174_21275 [Polyangiaceae bacterium]